MGLQKTIEYPDFQIIDGKLIQLTITLKVLGYDLYHSNKKGIKSEFSNELLQFKIKGTNKDKFCDYILKLYTIHLKQNPIDIVTIMPSHEKNKIDKNLESLAISFCGKSNLKFNKVLNRNRDIKPMHTLNLEERRRNVKGSLDLLFDVKGKVILLIDDICTTGVSMLESKELLIKNGALKVIPMAVGLTYNKDLSKIEKIQDNAEFTGN